MLRLLTQVLADGPWPSELGRPSLEDLHGDLYDARAASVVDRVATDLSHGPVALLGPRDQGKTFMALGAAALYLRRHLPGVAGAVCWYVRSDDVDDAAIAELRGTAELAPPRGAAARFLVVVDDIHRDPVRSRQVLQEASGALAVLLVGTELPEDLTGSFGLPSVRTLRWRAAESDRLAVIDRFVARLGAPAPGSAEKVQFLNAVGSGMSRVARGLTEWRSGHYATSLDEVDEHSLQAQVRSHYRLHPTSPVHRLQLLHLLATLSDLELGLPIPLSGDRDRELIGELQREGLVDVETLAPARPGGSPLSTARLADEKAGSLLRGAIEGLGAFTPQTLEAQLLPMARSSTVAWVTTRRLAASRRADTLAALLRRPEVQAALQATVPSRTGAGILSWCLHINDGLRAADRDLVGVVLTDEALQLIGPALTQLSMNRLRKVLQILAQAAYLPDLFFPWAPDDWQRLAANAANINQVRIFAYSLERWRLLDALTKFTHAIAEDQVLRRLLGAADATLGEGGLNGFIGNVRRLAPEGAAAVIAAAAETPELARLVATTRPGDTEWLVNTALELDPALAGHLVERLEGSLRTALRRDPPLYLFISICLADPAVAARLVPQLPADLDPTAGTRARVALHAVRDLVSGRAPGVSWAARGGDPPALADVLHPLPYTCDLLTLAVVGTVTTCLTRASERGEAPAVALQRLTGALSEDDRRQLASGLARSRFRSLATEVLRDLGL